MSVFHLLGLVFIFYPILPLLANFAVLLKRPSDMKTGISSYKSSTCRTEGSTARSSMFSNFKSSMKTKRASVLSLHTATMTYLKKGQSSKIQKQKESIVSKFEAAEYYAILTTAISGGVESPVQFVIQVTQPILKC